MKGIDESKYTIKQIFKDQKASDYLAINTLPFGIISDTDYT